jgi:hypothetical protein
MMEETAKLEPTEHPEKPKSRSATKAALTGVHKLEFGPEERIWHSFSSSVENLIISEAWLIWLVVVRPAFRHGAILIPDWKGPVMDVALVVAGKNLHDTFFTRYCSNSCEKFDQSAFEVTPEADIANGAIKPAAELDMVLSARNRRVTICIPVRAENVTIAPWGSLENFFLPFDPERIFCLAVFEPGLADLFGFGRLGIKLSIML